MAIRSSEKIKGVEGYDKFIPLFVESCQSLDFHIVCKDFIPFLPNTGAKVLDAGAGAGQNAAALAELGYNVTAVEPMQAFIDAAKETYQGSTVGTKINWLNGSLPNLDCLGLESSDTADNKFDLVLIEGVWHHLNDIERAQAIVKLSSIINLKGICAISLRNGPAGMGTRVFKTDAEHTIELFKQYGFECVLNLKDQASILPHKEAVKWSRIVVKKSR